MAFDFPTAPADGATFTPAGGPTYVYSVAVPGWLLQDETIVLPPPLTFSIGLTLTGNDVALDPATIAEIGGFLEAPNDANTYGRKANAWAVIPAIHIVRIVRKMLYSSGTYVKDPTLLFLDVGVVGGGGGGGYGRAGPGWAAAGSGAGGASLARTLYDAASLAASINYTIGAAGAGGVSIPASVTPPSKGGTSTFLGQSSLGGEVGQMIPSTNQPTIIRGGGPGSASGGQLYLVGGGGSMAIVINTTAPPVGGVGGHSGSGSGGGHNWSGAGGAGNGFMGSGGGGGSTSGAAASNANGGSGGAGYIELIEYHGD